MKRYLVALIFLFNSFVFPSLSLYATNSDIAAWQGGGTYYNVDVFRQDQNANVFISSYNTSTGINVPHTIITNQGAIVHSGSMTVTGNLTLTGSGSPDVYYGNPAVAISSTALAADSRGSIFTAVLAGGVAAVEGSALVAVSSGAIGGTSITVAVAPASALGTSVVGIAVAAASTGSVINVYDSGWVNAQTVGTIVAGDQVYTSTVPGFLSAIQFSTGPLVGIALQAGPNAFGGLTKIKLR